MGLTATLGTKPIIESAGDVQFLRHQREKKGRWHEDGMAVGNAELMHECFPDTRAWEQQE